MPIDEENEIKTKKVDENEENKKGEENVGKIENEMEKVIEGKKGEKNKVNNVIKKDIEKEEGEKKRK